MSLQDIINSIVEFNGPNESDNEKIYSILSTLHNVDPTQYDATQLFDVYSALGYSINENHFNSIWDRFYGFTEEGKIYEPFPSDISIQNPDEPINRDLLPVSTYDLPLDGRVVYTITCTDKTTKEQNTFRIGIDFIIGDTLNDTDQLLQEEFENSNCDDITVELYGAWSSFKE